MQKNIKKRKKQKKPTIIIATLLIAAAVTASILLIKDIQSNRAKREEHLANVTMHIEEAMQKISVATETIAAFYTFIEQAEAFAERSDFETAITVFDAAKKIAETISYTEGITLAEDGIEEMHRRIIIAKRNEAMEMFNTGDKYYRDSQYTQALEYLYKALDIYIELDDHQNINLTTERINASEQRLAEMEADNQEPPPADESPQDESEEQIAPTLNYEHNRSISFDMRTLIDYQNQSPANRVRMGTTDGLNEGWYNGCGWIATYNALIILENPKHPAEIVRYFEESGGIAFGGVFGTYPNAIEAYLRSLGNNVSHTLFPQVNMNIDEVIKNSQVSILAYLHTNAAHYVTIEYREDIDKFIVYNDNFARIRSSNLGFQNYTDLGAAIDSVSAYISSTREILFSFSLIVVS